MTHIHLICSASAISNFSWCQITHPIYSFVLIASVRPMTSSENLPCMDWEFGMESFLLESLHESHVKQGSFLKYMEAVTVNQNSFKRDYYTYFTHFFNNSLNGAIWYERVCWLLNSSHDDAIHDEL